MVRRVLFYYTLMAYETDRWGTKMLAGTYRVLPGDNLYTVIREFALSCGLGKYRIFDQDPDSPTHLHHLFENGMVKIVNTIEKLPEDLP